VDTGVVVSDGHVVVIPPRVEGAAPELLPCDGVPTRGAITSVRAGGSFGNEVRSEHAGVVVTGLGYGSEDTKSTADRYRSAREHVLRRVDDAPHS
jgi:hypothetical protein